MRRLLLLALAPAAGLTACSSAAAKTGLRIDVDPAEFGDAVSITVAIRAADVGFVMRDPETINGGVVRVKTDDLDGDGLLELLAQFQGPFRQPIGFRLDTENTAPLELHVDAMAYDDNDMIAADSKDAPPLPAGGAASVALKLAGKMGPIGPNTRTTDLQTAAIDVKINGSMMGASPSALAVCDVNRDGQQDIVIGARDGAPEQSPLGSTGAVYIIWGGSGAATIDLAADDPNQQFRFFGRDSGDQLGAAVGCVDLDGDGAGDLIVGAPAASGGQGRVYVVFGRPDFKVAKAVNLLSPTDTGIDVMWTIDSTTAGLGNALHAADIDGDGHAEILAAAKGAQEAHLFRSPTKPSAGTTTIDAGLADHVVFTGAAITSISAGDLDSTPPLDVVLGHPSYRDASDQGMRRGAAYVFANVNPALTSRIAVGMANRTAIGTGEDSQLGVAVLIASTTGLVGEDLYIGAPGEDQTIGVVYVFPHDSDFFLPSTFNMMNAQKISGYEPAGLFGSALAVARAGTDPPIALRLAVGAPGVSRPNRSGAGGAYLYKADDSRKFRIFEQVFGAGAQDALGTAVAGGQLNGDAKGDLVVAAPGAANQSGAVYVRLGL